MQLQTWGKIQVEFDGMKWEQWQWPIRNELQNTYTPHAVVTFPYNNLIKLAIFQQILGKY